MQAVPPAKFSSPLRSLATTAIVLCVCFVCGGATCARRDVPLPYPPPPVVFEQTPSLEQVAEVINRTSTVQQLSSNSATVEVLTMPNLPKLRATLNLQREQRFRLRANLPIVLGAGLDMGSNEEMFWFEVPEGMSKTLYYARHDQYRQQLRRAILPVDPSWIMDALGLVQIDPATVVAGPIMRDDGKLEIRNTISMPDGTYQRVCFINPPGGYITDQYLYAPGGNLIAQSQASNHAYYEQQQCVLPHRVEIHLAPAVGPPLSMRIDVGSYSVNQLLSGDPQLFMMPTSASQAVDLTTLSDPTLQPAVVPAPAPINYSASVPSAYPLRGETR
jgi:hypothetical protein